MPAIRRWRVLALTVTFIVTCLYYYNQPHEEWNFNYTPKGDGMAVTVGAPVHWHKLPERYPVKSPIALPTGAAKTIPKIQVPAPTETAEQKTERLRRRDVVKESFLHSWNGYKKNAWLRDEVAPLSGAYKDTFGGWAATLVDALDTLWIMGLEEEFKGAVKAALTIDFTTTETRDINVFETTIRYLGGFLAAYDISGGDKGPGKPLLKKAVEVGELLMGCFDTPNRMPITRWDWKKYTAGEAQKAPTGTLVSELGSLSLEFTRLSQLTGDLKYYDAVQRIGDVFEDSQNSTKLPGLWPVMINPQELNFKNDNFFTLGGMSDSLYEYLPKQYLILSGKLEQPRKLYEEFIKVAKEQLFFRFYNPKNEALTAAGDVRVHGNGDVKLLPRTQHLTCFTGGMVGLASKIFERPDELAIAEELTQGCIWAYDSGVNGIMPEIHHLMPCPKPSASGVGGDCTWSDALWHQELKKDYRNSEAITEEQKTAHAVKTAAEIRLPKGFTGIDDRRYILRPEAIESVFLMLRMTGKQVYADAAWRMFQAVEKISRTEIAAAAIQDVTTGERGEPASEAPSKVARRDEGKREEEAKSEGRKKAQQVDSMESFWLAETLKYFYLCFDEWEGLSLDEFVLNTEAHPLRRGK